MIWLLESPCCCIVMTCDNGTSPSVPCGSDGPIGAVGFFLNKSASAIGSALFIYSRAHMFLKVLCL